MDKKELLNDKYGYSKIIGKDATPDEIFELFKYIAKQRNKPLLLSFLDYIANEQLYYGLENDEKYSPLAISLIASIMDPEWLCSFGYNLLNVFEKKKKYEEAAYYCFSLGGKLKPYLSREDYFLKPEKAKYVLICKKELGRCLFNGIGTLRNTYKAISALYEIVGTPYLSYSEYYDMVIEAYKEIESLPLKHQYQFSKYCRNLDHYNEEDESVVDNLLRLGDTLIREIYKKATTSKVDYTKEKWFKELHKEIISLEL